MVPLALRRVNARRREDGKEQATQSCLRAFVGADPVGDLDAGFRQQLRQCTDPGRAQVRSYTVT